MLIMCVVWWALFPCSCESSTRVCTSSDSRSLYPQDKLHIQRSGERRELHHWMHGTKWCSYLAFCRFRTGLWINDRFDMDLIRCFCLSWKCQSLAWSGTLIPKFTHFRWVRFICFLICGCFLICHHFQVASVQIRSDGGSVELDYALRLHSSLLIIESEVLLSPLFSHM